MATLWRYLPDLFLLVTVVVSVSILLFVGTRLVQFRRAAKIAKIRLKLVPLAGTVRSDQQTADFFAVLHGLERNRSVAQKALHRHIVLAFEVHSTYDNGIWFEIVTPQAVESVVRHALSGYIPTMSVEEVNDPRSVKYSVRSYKTRGHYAFPIRLNDPFSRDASSSYITSSMANIDPSDELVFQVVVQPVTLTEARQLARRILGNEDLLGRLNSFSVPIVGHLMGFVSSFLITVLDAVGGIGSNGRKYESSYGSARISYETMQIKTRQKPARTLSTFELGLMQTMHDKLNEPLFRTSIRVGVATRQRSRLRDYFRSVETALGSFDVQTYQSFIRQKGVRLSNITVSLFLHRAQAIFKRNTSILSASELANLYLLSTTIEESSDNLSVNHSRTLPAPVSLKQNIELDVIFGENVHRNTKTPIGLTDQERERHMFVVGGTGQGKTTLLQYQIIQDMKAGKGVAVIDPHGDMAELLLRHVPEDRIGDVIYFNPDDLDHPIGMNLLEMVDGLEGNELARERDHLTESIVSVFRKIFSDDDSGGHRIEYVLRNTIHTALTVEGATIFTILKLLQNAKYRKSVIKSLEDEDLKDFWNNELGQAGGMQRVKMNAGITAKIGRFNSNAAAKLILGQKRSTIDFDKILSEGKILICNFSKGRLGEDVSELFGITVLARLQLASLRRARITHNERRPYYLYVDEFQNFATPSFEQLLSEARKYRLFLTMAEQSTAQQDDQQMVNIILANVGTVICFRTGSPDDERKLLPLFAPYIKPGEIANLPSYSFYAKVSASLTQEPMSGKTLLISEPGSDEVAETVIECSQMTYAGDALSISEQATPKSADTEAETTKPKKTAQNPPDQLIRIPGE